MLEHKSTTLFLNYWNMTINFITLITVKTIILELEIQEYLTQIQDLKKETCSLINTTVQELKTKTFSLGKDNLILCYMGPTKP